MTLPLLIHDLTSKWLCLAFGTGSTILLYQSTNRFHWKKPKLLPFDCIDKRVPQMPWTVWVYFTEYIIFFACYFSLKEWENLTRYALSYMFILVVSTFIFFIYPVTFPREQFPLDSFPDTLSKKALHFLRERLDTPANCLPSLHVSSCFISAFAFWFESSTMFWIFFIWSCLVAASTITTKQHYFVDVWTALLLTLTSFWIFFYGVSYSSGIS